MYRTWPVSIHEGARRPRPFGYETRFVSIVQTFPRAAKMEDTRASGLGEILALFGWPPNGNVSRSRDAERLPMTSRGVIVTDAGGGIGQFSQFLDDFRLWAKRHRSCDARRRGL